MRRVTSLSFSVFAQTMVLFSLASCAPVLEDDKDADAAGATDSGADSSQDDDGDGGGSGDDGGGDGSGDDGGGDGSGDDGGDDGAGDDGGDDGGSDGGGSDDGGSDDGDDPEEEEPEPVLLPVEGDWNLVDQYLSDDPCGVSNYQDPSGFIAEAYEVAHVDSETFALSASGEPPGDCIVSGGSSFTCAPAQVRQDLSSYGISADMVVDTEFNGTLDADFLTMTGATDITVTCDGDCWLVELALDFPCPMTIDMTLEAD